MLIFGLSFEVTEWVSEKIGFTEPTVKWIAVGFIITLGVVQFICKWRESNKIVELNEEIEDLDKINDELLKDLSDATELIDRINLPEHIVSKEQFKICQDYIRTLLLEIENKIEDSYENEIEKLDVKLTDETSRTNIYLVGKNRYGFHLVGRQSSSDMLRLREGMGYHRIHQGVLGKLWESGKDYIIENLPINDNTYNKRLMGHFKYEPGQVESMEMRSRTLLAIKIKDTVNEECVAIFICETKKNFSNMEEYLRFYIETLRGYNLRLIDRLNVLKSSTYYSTYNHEGENEES